MKLLLTSAGFTNKTISNALHELAGKPFRNFKLAFVPTAANVEEGEKDWLIDDLNNCMKLGFSLMDIVDISALPKDVWRPRLEEADILLFGGGNTFHLNYWLGKSGLEEMLPEMLKTRIYVGISAGSMVTTTNLALSSTKVLYSEEIGKQDNYRGLGFVDFHIRPHLNSPHFPKVRVKYLEKTTKKLKEPVYAIDDNTAIKVANGDISVVSEGKWKKFN